MKTRNLIFILTVLIILIGALFFIRNQKVNAVKEMKQITDVMMNDFRQGKVLSVRGLPADGQWYNRIVFEHNTEGMVSYTIDKRSLPKLHRQGKENRFIANQIADFKIRRQAEDVSLFEINIKTRGLWPVNSYFKVRMGD